MGLFDIFTTNNANDAAAAQRAGLNQAREAASGDLAQARDALNTNYTAALLPFQQNYGVSSPAYSGGTTALSNVLGLNGSQGYADALAAFQNSPGFQSALNTGNENVLRNASRTGDVRSGATNIDLQNVGQNLENQQWQQYIQNLLPFTQLGASGASSSAAGIGGLYSSLGNNLASNYNSLANLDYSTFTGMGNANANASLAGNYASANFVNALMGIAGLGTNTLGGSALSGVGGMIFSDERVKDDIERVGELDDGTNIYRYRYKDDPTRTTHIGVLAQEIEQTNPDAVVEIGGVKAVDYARATAFAAGLADLMEGA